MTTIGMPRGRAERMEIKVNEHMKAEKQRSWCWGFLVGALIGLVTPWLAIAFVTGRFG